MVPVVSEVDVDVTEEVVEVGVVDVVVFIGVDVVQTDVVGGSKRHLHECIMLFVLLITRMVRIF